ncbi:uncharacterized protein LOC111103686 isoform X2 [Crassostrea virginica]
MKVIAGLTISLSLFLGVTIADANCSEIAVNGTCVYGKYDGTIASEEFNETSQICTISGIYEKYNGGLEIKCCGNGTYSPEIEICKEGKVYNKTDETYRPEIEIFKEGKVYNKTDETYRPEIEIFKEGKVYNKTNETYRPEIEIFKEGKVYNKTNDRPDQPYTSLTHKCCGHMVKKIEERKGSRNFPKEIRHLWRSWLRKTKHKNLQIMYIHINKATIFPEVKQPEN